MKLWKHIGETYDLTHEQISTLLTLIADEVERRGTIDYDRDPGETSDWLRAEANESLKFQIAMTDNNHPITPPPELVKKWYDAIDDASSAWEQVATQAARWGADRELQLCLDWFQEFYKNETWVHKDLKTFMAARRPKPLSLKEKVLKMLDPIYEGVSIQLTSDEQKLILKAIKSLTD